MAYYDNVNPELLALTPEGVRNVLELGSGAGALARAVRDKCPQLQHYVGIELDVDQAEYSRSYTNITLIRNLDLMGNWDNDPEFVRALPAEGFDCVLIGDVLEHLRNPDEVLQQVVSHLAPSGCVIACIPNVQHWSVFVNLVRGTWPREEQGLFDRTHIRWFTLDDMISLFQTAGLNVSAITPREFPSQQGISFMEDLEPLARNLGANPDVLIARGQVLQFVLTGVHAAATPAVDT
jgi:SAM-dependent methyltransferase